MGGFQPIGQEIGLPMLGLFACSLSESGDVSLVHGLMSVAKAWWAKWRERALWSTARYNVQSYIQISEIILPITRGRNTLQAPPSESHA